MKQNGLDRSQGFNYEIFLPLKYIVHDSLEILHVNVELNSTSSVVIAIDIALQYFNQLNPNLSIDQTPENYLLYFAQKSGQPKFDFPALQNHFCLAKSKYHQFSLVPLNIVFTSQQQQFQGKYQGEQSLPLPQKVDEIQRKRRYTDIIKSEYCVTEPQSKEHLKKDALELQNFSMCQFHRNVIFKMFGCGCHCK